MSEQLERSQDPARRRHLPPQETPAETPPEKREDAEGEQKGKRHDQRCCFDVFFHFISPFEFYTVLILYHRLCICNEEL